MAGVLRSFHSLCIYSLHSFTATFSLSTSHFFSSLNTNPINYEHIWALFFLLLFINNRKKYRNNKQQTKTNAYETCSHLPWSYKMKFFCFSCAFQVFIRGCRKKQKITSNTSSIDHFSKKRCVRLFIHTILFFFSFRNVNLLRSFVFSLFLFLWLVDYVLLFFIKEFYWCFCLLGFVCRFDEAEEYNAYESSLCVRTLYNKC